MLKINLDDYDLLDIFKLILINKKKIIILYNSINGNKLNKIKIYSLISLIKNKIGDINYYFYNVPFCLFKELGRSFIDKHCIRNRLCNYYEGYITYGKCNICRYGLFCNNFNKNIDISEIIDLTGFYEPVIKKEYLLNILIKYKKEILKLGYKENEIGFYSTQKYIVEFLKGEIDYIGKNFLNYLTIYFLVNNEEISKRIFVSLDSFTLVLNNNKINDKFNLLIKRYGVNLNFTIGQLANRQKIYFNGEYVNLDYYYSRLKYLGKRDFFDFTNNFYFNKNITKYKGYVFNKIKKNIESEVFIIKKSGDLLKNKTGIYIGRDILGGINLNNYKVILISSDGLGDKGRLIQSIKSIRVPVIYDIKPDLTLFLKNGDNIEIDLFNGIIRKI